MGSGQRKGSMGSRDALRRVGVLGGTFDPVHIGHLVIAEEAAHQLGLDVVVFVPARVPPHKLGATITPAVDRVAMLELAISGNARFALSRVDLEREGPHYTVDMLRLLRRELEVGPGGELFFVMGADSLIELPTWRDPLGIARQARLAVLDRPGFEPDLAALDAALPGVRDRVDLLRVPLIGISGTDLRHRVREGRPIRYLVPEAVEAYIEDHGLYCAGEGKSAAGGSRGSRGVANSAGEQLRREDPSAATLLIATSNAGKLREYRRILDELPLRVASPADVGLSIEVEETGETFEENARLKAEAYSRASGLPALADDSGLEVDALDGFPGVRSSRWIEGSDDDRVRALLDRMRDVPDERRTARFRAVACLARPRGLVRTAAGTVEGRIARQPRGEGGFGYDPVFLVEDGGYEGEVTVAELEPEEKDGLSHRGRAVRALWNELQALAEGADRGSAEPAARR